MRQVTAGMAVIALVMAFGGGVAAQQTLVEGVAKSCEKELTTYCKDVTPGEGRSLACLYAYWEKLSDQCDYALYDAAAQLGRAVNALTYTMNECRDDLTTYCATILPGEGRLLQCIDKNEAKVSKRCKQALKDTGLKK
jgi:hypothetical protein